MSLEGSPVGEPGLAGEATGGLREEGGRRVAPVARPDLEAHAFVEEDIAVAPDFDRQQLPEQQDVVVGEQHPLTNANRRGVPGGAAPGGAAERRTLVLRGQDGAAGRGEGQRDDGGRGDRRSCPPRAGRPRAKERAHRITSGDGRPSLTILPYLRTTPRLAGPRLASRSEAVRRSIGSSSCCQPGVSRS